MTRGYIKMVVSCYISSIKNVPMIPWTEKRWFRPSRVAEKKPQNHGLVEKCWENSKNIMCKPLVDHFISCSHHFHPFSPICSNHFPSFSPMFLPYVPYFPPLKMAIAVGVTLTRWRLRRSAAQSPVAAESCRTRYSVLLNPGLWLCTLYYIWL